MHNKLDVAAEIKRETTWVENMAQRKQKEKQKDAMGDRRWTMDRRAKCVQKGNRGKVKAAGNLHIS